MSQQVSKEFKAWQKRIQFITAEYDFGPFTEFRNEEGRLHRDGGPAYISPTRCIDYQDGRRHGLFVDIYGTISYYFENIMVPRKFILSPESITVEEVFAQSNTEIRYAALKIFGYDNIMNSKYYRHIHSDKETGAELFEVKGIFDDPMSIVKVINGTPERNGEYKHYFLQVPPEMRTCAEAIAWTFYKTAADYQPSQEA